MTTKVNGAASNDNDADNLPTSELTRPTPDAILADEADPDTLLGLESDSEAGGTSRPTSMLTAEALAKRKSKRISRQQQFLAQQTAVVPDKPLSALTSEELQIQIGELSNQVTGLNGKLVNSFTRIGDLEDDLSDLQDTIQRYKKQIEDLEKERQEHLAALNTGLLVEKEHVSTEMQKMMERLVEETAEKGKAVSDKQKIEAELDELSSSLFSEANKMVANERLARARAEEKSNLMEERLKDTEEIVGQQQKRLTRLQTQLEKSGLNPDLLTLTSPQDHHRGITGLLRRSSQKKQNALIMPESGSLLRLDIIPYVELRTFLNYLRRLRIQLAPFYTYVNEDGASSTPTRIGSPAPVSTPQPPSSPFLAAGVTRHKDFPTLPANVEQLVYLPNQLSSIGFLKRINEEDCEPCLRLDIAPGLNWLSRRQMQTAILDGSLMIEPIFGGNIYEEHEVRMKSRHAPPAACAMCGRVVVNVPLPGGGQASDASAWMNAASSIQAGVNAVTSSLPGRDSTSSPPPQLPPREIRTRPSILNTLRNISGGGSGASSSSRSSSTNNIQDVITPPPQQQNSNSTQQHQQQSTSSSLPSSFGVVEDEFARRLPPIPTHIFRISEASTARYLLCPGYCLNRLRVACTFWGYIRNLERAVVLEGKYAFEDEHAQESQSPAPPRLPTKDDAQEKGSLQNEVEQSPAAEKLNHEEDIKESKESSDEKRKSLQATPLESNNASDVEDDHDFADAQSQHSSQDGSSPTVEKKFEEVKDVQKENQEVETEKPKESIEMKDETKVASPAKEALKVPPALPPRRSTPAISATPATPNTAVSTTDVLQIPSGPEPRKFLPSIGNVDHLTWEEKIWQEINHLRAEMWSARVGVEQNINIEKEQQEQQQQEAEVAA